jgi:hypothetical protein
VGSGLAAHNNGDDWARQSGERIVEFGPFQGQALRADPIGCAQDGKHIGPDQAVVRWRDHQIKPAKRRARVLGLDHKGLARRQSQHPRRKRQGRAA